MNPPGKLVLGRHIFALVNGGSPGPNSFCVMCEELIGEATCEKLVPNSHE